jgi:uncharacterized protein YggU (UPF0235/DUF167 family)
VSATGPDDQPLRLRPAPDGRGCLLLVRAQPGARRCGVQGTWNGHLKVGLRSPPEGGRANDELLDLLARLLGLRRTGLCLQRGTRSRNKVVALDAPAPRVLERLLPLLREPR